MITSKKLNENYDLYKELLLKSCSSNDDKEGLIVYLDNTDLRVAPASTIYHGNFEGGLVVHSLNVYNNILKINECFGLSLNTNKMTRVALLHDLAKTDFYEKYIQNRKEYNDRGRQSDANGRFDWIQVESYKIKDSKFREHVFGEHGLCSFMIANKYLKLEDDEAAAIINHHMGLDNGKVRTDISEVMNRYPLAIALCLADQAATYINENPYMVE